MLIWGLVSMLCPSFKFIDGGISDGCVPWKSFSITSMWRFSFRVILSWYYLEIFFFFKAQAASFVTSIHPCPILITRCPLHWNNFLSRGISQDKLRWQQTPRLLEARNCYCVQKAYPSKPLPISPFSLNLSFILFSPLFHLTLIFHTNLFSLTSHQTWIMSM